jgi:glycosyltransferase involved in cell wall biosynthesis
MRILMLNNEFPPLGGGMGTANKALFDALADYPDIEVDLITSALGAHREARRFSGRIQIFGVPVWNRNIHHSTNRELLTYAVQALPLAYRLHRRQAYDLCFAWSTVPAGGVALSLKRLCGLPYQVWVSGPDIPGFEQRYRAIYPLLTPTIRSIWRGATAVIAKCAEEITMMQRVVPGLEITLIPNGVDLCAFQPAAPPPESEPLRIICVARLIERKGQHHLIEAIKRLSDAGVDIQLELVGTGDAHAALEAQTRRLGIADRVVFSGYVPRENLPAHYNAADVFVLPSFNEGLSLAALEALASGLPLVLSRTGGTTDLVEEGVNGLTFEWGNVPALTEHLRRLAGDRALVRRMGAQSRRRAKRFGWPAITERFVELFEAQVAGRRLGAPASMQSEPS